jgi:hypothetical protein
MDPNEIEQLHRRIVAAVLQRQRLRARDASAFALEQNRREIVDLQWRFALALGRVNGRTAA